MFCIIYLEQKKSLGGSMLLASCGPDFIDELDGLPSVLLQPFLFHTCDQRQVQKGEEVSKSVSVTIKYP